MATEFHITIPQIKLYEEKYSRSSEIVKAALEKGLLQATIATQALARSQAPVKTGRLRSSIQFKVEGLKGVVFTPPGMMYAIYVESGTGQYGKYKRDIIPKTKKVLATKMNPGWGKPSKGGYFIIGKKSKGQKPNPFMKRTKMLAMPQIKVAFKEAEKLIIKELEVR